MATHLPTLFMAVVVAGAGCAASPPPARSTVGWGTNYTPKGGRKPVSDPSDEVVDDGSLLFDQEAAELVLKRGARKLKQCPKVAHTPPGEGNVEVVFHAKKGRITEVRVPRQWQDASNRAQRCITNAFLGEFVPPFDGSNKTISWPIVIPKVSEPTEDDPAASGTASDDTEPSE